MEWVASSLALYVGTWSIHDLSADPHSLTASSWLNWPPCRLKWTRPFAERPNLVSARVPSRFERLPYYSTALIISKNFHVLSSFNVNEMGSHWVLFLLYLNIVLSWPEDGWLRPKHVAKYNLAVIIASCLDVYCVLMVHNLLYKKVSLCVFEWIDLSYVIIAV